MSNLIIACVFKFKNAVWRGLLYNIIYNMTKKDDFRKIIIRWGLCLVVLMTVCFGLGLGQPAFAAKCGGADTSLIECDDSEGGIWHILSLAVDILSIGVGILGVIGILVAGIQFLTSKDNVAQNQKAKTRLFQITIGLAVYAVVFVFVEWLLPGGLLNAQSELANVGSTAQIEEINKIQEEARENATPIDTDSSSGGTGTAGSSSSGGSGSSSGGSGSGSGGSGTSSGGSGSSSGGGASGASDTAWSFAKGSLTYDNVAKTTGYYDLMDKNCSKIGGGDCNRGEAGYRTFCSGFVYNVLRYSGADPDFPMALSGKQMDYMENSSKWDNVTSSVNNDTSKLKAGDVLVRSGHILMITENSKGQLYTAQAALGEFEPKLKKIIGNGRLDNSAGSLSKYKVYRLKG